MKHTLWIMVALFLFIVHTSTAQAQEKKHPFALKCAPLNALFDDVNPALQVGVERHLSEKHSLQVEVGYIFNWEKNTRTLPDSVSADNTGFKIRLEGRRYITEFSKNPRLYNGLYLASEIFYTNTSYNTRSTFQHDGESYQDIYKVKKNVYGLNGKIGYQYKSKSWGFLFDAYVGLGIKYKNTTHEGRLHPQGNIYKGLELWGPDMNRITDQEFNGITLSVPVNFKLGYVF